MRINYNPSPLVLYYDSNKTKFGLLGCLKAGDQHLEFKINYNPSNVLYYLLILHFYKIIDITKVSLTDHIITNLSFMIWKVTYVLTLIKINKLLNLPFLINYFYPLIHNKPSFNLILLLISLHLWWFYIPPPLLSPPLPSSPSFLPPAPLLSSIQYFTFSLLTFMSI